MTDYTKPPVSPEDMDVIERRHEREEAAVRVLGAVQVKNTVEHHDRGRLIEQLNYTAAVMVSMGLQLAEIRGDLAEAKGRIK